MDLKLVGVASGDLAHLTAEARAAILAADVLLIPKKGDEKEELAAARLQLCDLIRGGEGVGVRLFDMPVRDPSIGDYRQRVECWHDAIADSWAKALQGVAEGAQVVLLVWGDPSLYDSTLRIAARLQKSRSFTLSVLPGLTSVQLLTAAHTIPLNTLAEPFMVTTGRRLREQGWPAGVETVVVMLDGEGTFSTLDPEGIAIWWGAYLGMAGQILDHGPLAEAGPRILETRARARAERGWIMDCYVMRRQTSDKAP